MPYIKPEQRKRFDDALQYIPVPADAGELNYLITLIALKYFNFGPNPKRYQNINDICGVLHCASEEFYRKIVAIYEDLKAKENGDVYGETT